MKSINQKLFLTGALALAMVMAAGISACGNSSGNPAADGDDETTDSEDATEQEEVAVSKCATGLATKATATVDSKTGAFLHICDPSDPLDGSQVEIEDEADDEFTITIKAGSDLSMDGWKRIGPAVHYDSTGFLVADVPFQIPLDKSLLTEEMKDYTINILAKPNDSTVVRFIPKAKWLINIDRNLGLLNFEANFLGTFQAVVPVTPHATKEQNATYRAISGISMGGGGAGYIASKNPEAFDTIGMLGGPLNLTYLFNMINGQLLGGFCPIEGMTLDGTATGTIPEEYLGSDTDHECGVCMNQLEPIDPYNDYFKCYLVAPTDPDGMEHPNGFNHWYYDDNGGSFDRSEYVKLFRDLNFGFGNVAGYNPDSPYLSAGMPPEVIKWSFENPNDFCDPATLTQWLADRGIEYPFKNYVDNEYNPEGAYQVIAPCDGSSRRHEVGGGDFDRAFLPNPPNPMEFAVAVDYNGNGVRDYGEPIIRNTYEPFDDCGTDRLCNPDEPDYNATTNPDPSGDDWSMYGNPLGTEGNGYCDQCETADSGEKWYDWGLDGVMGTTQITDGGYDWGEGNNAWDPNPNLLAMLKNDTYRNMLKWTPEQFNQHHIYIDGGVRDIFNFAVHGNMLAGALNATFGADSMKLYDGFEKTMNPPLEGTKGFNYIKVDYGKLGKNINIRYGQLDATPKEIEGGNGRHVGTAQEVVYRVQVYLAYASYFFPKPDLDIIEDYDASEGLISETFYSPRYKGHRRYSVALPPGYFDPKNADKRYPVIYLMHGYGQEPKDNAAALLIMMPLMASGKVPKFITIFPDGECDSPDNCAGTCRDRDCKNLSGTELQACQSACTTECAGVHRECVRGTFYLNHVATYDHPGPFAEDEQKYGQVEDYFYDLVDYIDETYRTRSAETVTVDAVTGEWVY